MFIHFNGTGKYLYSAVAITYALISSAYIIQIDKDKKYAVYYTFGSIVLALFTAFTIHFGGTVNRVLTEPLFLTVMMISMFVIIISFIVLIIQKVKFQIIWITIGWIIIGIANLIQIKIAILVGIMCLTIYFIFFKQY